MKLTAVLTLTLLNFTSFSQVTKAFVQFAIDVEAVDTSMQTKQMVGMFYDSSMKLFFTEKKSRVDFKMGKLYTASVVMDGVSDSALVLQAGPMGNFAKYQLNEEFGKNKPESTDVKIEKLNEFKKILGYNCEKINYINDGKKMTYWITEEIVISKDLGQDIVNADLPGFPLEFSASDGQVIFHYKASNVALEIPDEETLFSIKLPEGFKLLPQ